MNIFSEQKKKNRTVVSTGIRAYLQALRNRRWRGQQISPPLRVSRARTDHSRLALRTEKSLRWQLKVVGYQSSLRIASEILFWGSNPKNRLLFFFWRFWIGVDYLSWASRTGPRKACVLPSEANRLVRREGRRRRPPLASMGGDITNRWRMRPTSSSVDAVRGHWRHRRPSPSSGGR